ncbi:nucleotide sugar dehydrogenase [Eisenibacter elegans]|uniref:nucleotide sugar dehydrogenase n=1 Tax=Eisenibacter elegans TaxID=997 RepID=UPI0004112197|nr:nucleotide sugar dehydrogenase [Eisenibacter elegans]
MTPPPTIAIIGLGYVGLPLAVAFGAQYPTIGYDINPERIRQLRQGLDQTLELDTAQMAAAKHLQYTDEPTHIGRAQYFIITVPTPIDAANQPDLSPLRRATQLVAPYLKQGDVVVYESTVYPGCTEEVCVPILEELSGLRYNQDFFCGYSPERINPGDKKHTLPNIIKVVSGSTPTVAQALADLYGSIIPAGIHLAPSIKVAEAAKVIENAQRDINIAFMNELAIIFDKLGIRTEDVLAAARTKWNFLPFHPGLVGGHCIGVDPYYLTHKAQSLGYHPEVILAGRRINDYMGTYVAQQMVKQMAAEKKLRTGAKVLILGFTFKPNIPDIRNTKVIDVVRELESFGLTVDIFDPLANAAEVQQHYGLHLLPTMPALEAYDHHALLVKHDWFAEQAQTLKGLL